MKHLLVTNDFPPKIGGIQSLLWEWWRRLPPDRFAVLTSPYAGTAEFDAEQPYRIERTREPFLLPHPWMVRKIDAMARDVGADLIVLGNNGDRTSGRVVRTLSRYLADRDPILRAHAVWAARRLSLDHLLPATDPDPDVSLELTRSSGT